MNDLSRTASIVVLNYNTCDLLLQVPPDDVVVLAQSIQRLLVDADLRAWLRAAGLAWAAAFTWEETARRAVQVYERIVNANLS